MQYAWLAIIGLSLIPVAVVAYFLNPLVLFALGAEAWRDRVSRLVPYRWWIAFAIFVCGFATTVYTVHYG